MMGDTELSDRKGANLIGVSNEQIAVMCLGKWHL
jgi:hypothetical protein